ncbi:MBL fold metallo-hydrolase [Aquimarina sp. MMG015]|uniref:MBL fold metallo-hydrolase n=1 Tax=unclassified Aquimarina TaxID=2627091 RepID=UPI000E4E7EFD|nr:MULTISPECIES: MBL fold metallo-hydrolase [unclassified Aquimarina]AXT54908.1 MBL fold metallo-hydrolase [Aquimarina sp. AD1]MBQ4805747.1 MBL fold metallo-hydrolase [Aquimarina sp. MMG015]RKN03420.1 MBL fold metallo-hydrolase [Aquimarina sp. AD1]
MEVTFLGTGTSQGIPIIGSTHPVCLSKDQKDKRLRVSVLVSWDEYQYVIDCGPDFRQQMLTNEVDRIDGIIFTHEHADHTMGMDDIRPFFFRQGDIPVYAHKRVLNALRTRFSYIFSSENKYPGAPSVIENELTNQPFSLGNLDVIPIDLMHNRLQVFGFRFKDFAYLTDVKTIEKKETEKLKGVKVLVVNALRIEPHHSHFNLEEALEFIDEVKPEKAYLTHISHMLGFHEEVQQQLPENVFLAYDNLKITI